MAPLFLDVATGDHCSPSVQSTSTGLDEGGLVRRKISAIRYMQMLSIWRKIWKDTKIHRFIVSSGKKMLARDGTMGDDGIVCGRKVESFEMDVAATFCFPIYIYIYT